MFLNENIYQRFWLKTDLLEVQKWFKSFVKNLFLDEKWLLVINKPDYYKESWELYKVKQSITKEFCRQCFFDYSKYSDLSYWFWLLIDKLSDEIFSKYLVQLQILLNIIYNEKFIRNEYYNFINNIKNYLDDFPQLWLNIKIYKTKKSELFPILNNKILNKNIDNLLWILETSKYKNTLQSLEEGLKIFLFTKINWDLKNVVEDMLATCDEFVKEFLWEKNKWFKHIFKDWEFEKFWLNKQNKEIYRTLRDYMDNIKHWSFKDYWREDVEMIINLVVTFINFSLSKIK